MGNVKKLLAGTLSVVFVLSFVSPFCCHTDWADLLVHSRSSSPAHHHTHNDDSSAGCSHHLVKNLSKPDPLLADPNQSVSSAVILIVDTVWKRVANIHRESLFRLIFFNKTGPPIHLLNSVFLN